MDNFWSLEEERQRLVNELHMGGPGEDEYENTLKALKEVDSLVPKKDDGIHWNKVIEAIIPIGAGIGLTVLFEQIGHIFTSKSTFFWRK